MAQQQQPFTTLPRGFQYCYDERLQTPEPELSSAAELIASPPRGRGFRVRRRRDRTRGDTSTSTEASEMMPGISTQISGTLAELQEETTLPSIEVSEQETVELPEAQPPIIERLLTPFQPILNDLPHTPEGREPQRACTPAPRESFNETIKRPSSPNSSMSDSEDETRSIIGSEDGHSYGGSVTSPESDAADPFQYDAPSKSFDASSPSPRLHTGPIRRWTKAMDEHIWSIYSTYLNDPTVTPFKTLPGHPPPAGVCHRIASRARKTWKGARTVPGRMQRNNGLEDSAVPRQLLPWPGAGSATRHRFRKLCRRNAHIIPYYQRMMRSPSPPRLRPEGPRVQVTETRSPVALYPRGSFTNRDWQDAYASNTYSDPFTTRDVAMSLATSTSATMQPDGPLAQMASEVYQDAYNRESRASGATIPSNAEETRAAGASINRLRSPFTGSNTWGPSNVQGGQQPHSGTTYLSDSERIPRGARRGVPLGSPVQFEFASSASAARMPKRPATSALGDDEVGNGDAAARRMRHEDVSGTSFLDASRRLRLRGMSLGARFAETDRYVSEPSTFAGLHATEVPVPLIFTSLPPGIVRPVPIEDPFIDPPQTQPIQPAPPRLRLRSPFPGIGTRPSRGRHASSLSLPSVPDLGSVDQRMSEDIAE